MAILNFEFKARTHALKNLEDKLLTLNPKFIGEDNQTDTYFNVTKGRLKLREGNIENSLIYYERQNTTGAKQSEVLLYHNPGKILKDILIKLHGIKVVVDKRRRIYFVDNVKFHFDIVRELGTFIEVEAIDNSSKIGIEKLKDQCDAYARLFNIQPHDYIAFSYSDMLLINK